MNDVAEAKALVESIRRSKGVGEGNEQRELVIDLTNSLSM
jgi:hypothetical protein